MTEKECVDRTIDFVKKKLEGAEAGHDWFHIERVYQTALMIADSEEADIFVVSMGALLHDIADSKFHGGDEAVGPQIAEEFLRSLEVDSKTVSQVLDIIREVSFKNTLSENRGLKRSLEMQVVQDADRLDALGAIGIARAFHYGGFKNRLLYDPSIAPNPKMTREQYKNSESPTINHFYEKLLLLKDQMNTETAKVLAMERHAYMLDFLDQFYKEWKANN